MICSDYEGKIRDGMPIEQVLADREGADRKTVLDAIMVWAEETQLIAPSGDASNAIQHLNEVLPDFVDDECREIIESEARRRTLFTDSADHAEPGSLFGPTLTDGHGRYRIERLIGKGTQGCVYLAIDRKFRGPQRAKVAIKMHTRIDAIRGVRAQSIDHPNVVAVHDHDIDLHGEPTAYIVYQFLDGPTLEEWAQNRKSSMREIIEIMIQLCSGVQSIHSLPIVHRDLKPSNIIMVNGRPVIADFGIAADAHDDQTVAGSPLCMAPEQLGHEEDTILVDIYGIGAIMYFLLTGEYPNGESEATAISHLAGTDELSCEIIQGPIREIVKKCLARSPADRFQSAEAIKLALDDLRRFRSSNVPRHRVLRRFVLFTRRNPLSSALAVVVLAVLVTIVINQRDQVRNADALRMSNEQMKSTFQKTILDARLRDGELNPATYWAIVELSEHITDWEVWSYAALTTMEGELMLREEVERQFRDPEVSRVTAAFWWWLLAKVQRAADMPDNITNTSFETARNLFVSMLGDDDPIVRELARDWMPE